MNKESRKVVVSKLLNAKEEFPKEYFGLLFRVKEEEITYYLDNIYSNKAVVQKAQSIMFPSNHTNICSAKLFIDPNVSIKTMLKFCIVSFKQYYSKLHKYLWLKKIYEKNIVIGEYKKCISILNQIEKEIGFSLWSIVSKMAFIDSEEGLQGHKEYVSRLLLGAETNPIIKRIIEIKSQFAEQETDYWTYKKKVDEIKTIKGIDTVEKMYLDFKLSPERCLDSRELCISLMVDAQISLIDLYETYVISSQALFINEGILCDFEYFFDDFRLTNIIRIVRNDPKLVSDKRFYSIVELYTCGEYQECINICAQYLEEKPVDFQALILMIKSCLLSDTSFDTSNKIYKDVYDLYSFNGEEDATTKNILSSLKMFIGTSMEYKILNVVARKTFMPNRELFTRMSVLCDNNLSPNITNFPDFIKSSPTILDSFIKLCPITTKLYKYKHGRGKFPEEIIDTDRYFLFKADEYISNNDSFNAIKALDLIERTDTYYKERILRRKIRAYRISGDYFNIVKCVSIFLLENIALVKRIDLSNLYSELKRHLTKNIKESIYYVVFVYFCFPENIRLQRIAYANYMEGNGLNSVEKICTNVSDVNFLVFFLDEVCRIDLLKRDEILNPDMNKADSIRIEILKHLISINPCQERKYYLEISSITKDMSIKYRIRQINNSRIYVDVENIKKEIDNDLQREFSRYLAMKDIDGEDTEYNQVFLGLDSFQEKYIDNQEVQEKVNWIIQDIQVRMNRNPLYAEKINILKDIITSITKAFLFDEKYGLNTFLSSRIRHGFCKSQLTSAFDEYKLLSKKKKNSSSEYPVNEYWDKLLPNNCSGSHEFRKYLSDFTSEIEKMVETIKDKWLNIKFYDSRSNALLDYTPALTNILLAIESDNILDYNDFFYKIVNILWIYTDCLFNNVKAMIRSELSTFFLEQLTELTKKIARINDPLLNNEIDELNNNIILCKANYEKSLNQFITVLDRNNVVYWNFTMNELVDTCLEIENRLNVHFSDVNIVKSIKEDNEYKGAYFPYFVDIITILLNNAFEHSGMQHANDIRIEIDIYQEKEKEINRLLHESNYSQYLNQFDGAILFISVSNLLDESVDLYELSDKMKKLFEQLRTPNTSTEFLQKEGGTGLIKLNNTLQSNICEPYIILYPQIINQFLTISIVLNVNRILDECNHKT